MTTTLPTPTHGAEYTNSATGDKFKYDSDTGAWEGFEGIDRSGDSMTGTIAYPDMLINGNTLTADDDDVSGDDDTDMTAWVGYPSSNESNSWYSVTYGVGSDGIGRFVAVADAGSQRVMHSEDGINWTGEWGHDSNVWQSVTYGNGKFVAVASSGTTNRVMYSEDGITWTGVPSSNDSNHWRSVTYGVGSDGIGRFVAVASYGSNRVMYSEDGITWTARLSSNDSNKWYSITYGAGKFVAVAETGSNRVMYSTDGITWTGVASSNESNKWHGVTYGAGKFVAVAWSGSNKVMYSEDGIKWTGLVPPSDSNEWYSVTYGVGKFVAVANYGYKKVMYSTDGIGWFDVNAGTSESNSWKSVTYGAGKFVAVAGNYSRRVMVLDAPEGSRDLYFKGNPVVIDKGQTKALARSISGLSSRFGKSRYYTSEEPSDSFGIDNGTLWLNPSNAKLSIYHDSDWNQLN